MTLTTQSNGMGESCVKIDKLLDLYGKEIM